MLYYFFKRILSYCFGSNTQLSVTLFRHQIWEWILYFLLIVENLLLLSHLRPHQVYSHQEHILFVNDDNYLRFKSSFLSFYCLVSSWPGNQDLPISSSWADNTSEWPGSHYGRRADHSRYRQEESQSQFRNGVGQSQLRNGSSQAQFRNEVNKSLHRNGADQPQYRNGVEQQQYRNQEDQSQFSADQSNYRNGMNQSQYRNGIDQYRNTTSGWNSVTDWETLPGTSGRKCGMILLNFLFFKCNQ